jgi:hypothetical protein
MGRGLGEDVIKREKGKTKNKNMPLATVKSLEIVEADSLSVYS